MPSLEITLHGPHGARVTYQFARETILIGRAPDCDLVIHDPSISRHHLELRHEAGVWLAADDGSHNGTKLNGAWLSAPSPLTVGDEMTLGRSVLRVGREGAANAVLSVATEQVDWSNYGTGEQALRDELVGHSPAIALVREAIERMASASQTLLILGESGTGKEVVARLLHRLSGRAGGPFVPVCCPALAPSLLEAELFGVEKGVATGVEARAGRFEAAQGGTLFLDEIGDLELGAQAKLLRVLQEKRVERIGGRREIPLDVRVVAATNHDLAAEVAHGSFRRDLYHRLKVLTIELPPLRERREDIPLLAGRFLADAVRPLTLAADASACLLAYDFPGNVRELEHALESAALLARGPAVTAADLPREMRAASAPPASASASAAVTASVAVVDDIVSRLAGGSASFWDEVQRPFLRRQISRDDARAVVSALYQRAGGSYRGMARQLGIEAQYHKLFSFLTNHGLKVD